MVSKIKSSRVLFISIMVVSALILSGIFVYGNKNIDYVLDDVQISTLFESEQQILEIYNISQTLCLNSVERISETNGSESASVVENIETLTFDSLGSLKIIELNDEYNANNRLSGREIDIVEGLNGFIWPLPGYTYISSPYGYRLCEFHGYEFHNGVDIPAPEGTPIRACKAGFVSTSDYNDSYGYYIVVTHTDGGKTLYAHMVGSGLDVGVEVQQGDVIGGVGNTGDSTGNHLHFEIWTNGDISSRVDPLSMYNWIE